MTKPCHALPCPGDPEAAQPMSTPAGNDGPPTGTKRIVGGQHPPTRNVPARFAPWPFWTPRNGDETAVDNPVDSQCGAAIGLPRSVSAASRAGPGAGRRAPPVAAQH